MSEHSVQLYSVRDAFAADPADTLRRRAAPRASCAADPAAPRGRPAAIGFTQVEPYGVVENVEALRAGLPANGLSAPTAHARLIGADQAAVFPAAAELGIGLVIDPLVKPEQWQDPAGIAATADAL